MASGSVALEPPPQERVDYRAAWTRAAEDAGGTRPRNSEAAQACRHGLLVSGRPSAYLSFQVRALAVHSKTCFRPPRLGRAPPPCILK